MQNIFFLANAFVLGILIDKNQAITMLLEPLGIYGLITSFSAAVIISALLMICVVSDKHRRHSQTMIRWTKALVQLNGRLIAMTLTCVFLLLCFSEKVSLHSSLSVFAIFSLFALMLLPILKMLESFAFNLERNGFRVNSMSRQREIFCRCCAYAMIASALSLPFFAFTS
jgi:L-asparagine transporter-like permease